MGPGSKFTKTHAAVLAIIGSGVAGGGAYVAHQNSGEADRAAGGGVVKQDVAVNDRDGNLRMAMQGFTGKDAASKANDPTPKADNSAKASDVDILKKLENVANDAGIKAEAAGVTEVAQSTEKPYIPEAAKLASDEAEGNLLDGSGSNAFKSTRFTTSGSGSGSNAVKAAQSGGKGVTKSVSGANASAAKVAATTGSGAKGAATTSESPTSGKKEIAKAGGNKEDETGEKTVDNSKKPESKEALSFDKNERVLAGNKDKPGTGRFESAYAPSGNVDATLSNVRAEPTEEQIAAQKKAISDQIEKQKKFEAQRREKYLSYLKEFQSRSKTPSDVLCGVAEAFVKPGNCDIDDHVPPSDRKAAGVKSTEAMLIAAKTI